MANAKTLMIQGTMSSVGKSLLVTALCRYFARQGIRVAPFKAQNMSNNAAVCTDGSEIGRAQYTQALAAKVEPTVDMNPVLLKPQAVTHAEMVVMGRPVKVLEAASYADYKAQLWSHVTSALDRLRNRYDLIMIEGAGSPVELNLKAGDIVNMAVARYASSSVVLVGDIDRGGIFAQLLGTLALLDQDERALVRGLIANKFRGELAFFADGIQILEQRSGLPVLGVVPYIPKIGLPEEDAATLAPDSSQRNAPVDIAVIYLPHIANFDDFDPLAAEPGVQVRYVGDVATLGNPSAIILPGTKSTIADLMWLQEQGLANAIRAQAHNGIAVVGICGGYQMLGQVIHDPHHVESGTNTIQGFGLLPVETTFHAHKTTHQVQARVTGDHTWLAAVSGQTIHGYEIHMGQTISADSWLCIERHNSELLPDGAINSDGKIWGCYLHGLFANDNLRRAWLRSLGWQGSEQAPDPLDAAFERLADHVSAALDVNQLIKIIDL